MITLNENYSTTQLLCKKRPEILIQRSDHFETKVFLPETTSRSSEGGLRTKGYFKKTFTDKPLITVVTIVYNGDTYLEETIKSVITQTYPNVEYIIIDGGSTDNTIDIIKKYDNVIDYWISEKDDGISDAFNKGIVASTGDLIGLLNADDTYADNTVLTQIADFAIGKEDEKIIHTNIQFIRENKKRISYPSDNIGRAARYSIPINHPGSFFDRKTYKKMGLYSAKYKIAMDYEMILRALSQNISFHYLPVLSVKMKIVGVSATSFSKGCKECYRIQNSYFGSIIFNFIILTVRIVMGKLAKFKNKILGLFLD